MNFISKKRLLLVALLHVFSFNATAQSSSKKAEKSIRTIKVESASAIFKYKPKIYILNNKKIIMSLVLLISVIMYFNMNEYGVDKNFALQFDKNINQLIYKINTTLQEAPEKLINNPIKMSLNLKNNSKIEVIAPLINFKSVYENKYFAFLELIEKYKNNEYEISSEAKKALAEFNFIIESGELSDFVKDIIFSANKVNGLKIELINSDETSKLHSGSKLVSISKKPLQANAKV